MINSSTIFKPVLWRHNCSPLASTTAFSMEGRSFWLVDDFNLPDSNFPFLFAVWPMYLSILSREQLRSYPILPRNKPAPPVQSTSSSWAPSLWTRTSSSCEARPSRPSTLPAFTSASAPTRAPLPASPRAAPSPSSASTPTAPRRPPLASPTPPRPPLTSL